MDELEKLTAQLLKTSLENYEAEVKERGFCVGARVKCKYVSHLGGKGFITKCEEGKITISWEYDNGQPIRTIPLIANLSFDGKYYIVGVGIYEEVRLWGIM